MTCACGSSRIAQCGGKVSDMFHAQMQAAGDVHEGYVPCDLGINDGDGDYIEFDWCLDCGRIQGEWPLPPTQLERPKSERDE